MNQFHEFFRNIFRENSVKKFREIAFLAVLIFFPSSKIDFWPILKSQKNGIWPKKNFFREIDLFDFGNFFGLDFLIFSSLL